MSATFNKFDTFAKAMADKVHNLGADTLQVALCATANTPVRTNSVLANLTEISYTNCSSRVISTTSDAQSTGTYKLLLAQLVLTASGGNIAAFQYVVVYNNTATNKELIGWFDYGASLVVTNGSTFTIGFDQVNGFLQIV